MQVLGGAKKCVKVAARSAFRVTSFAITDSTLIIALEPDIFLWHASTRSVQTICLPKEYEVIFEGVHETSGLIYSSVCQGFRSRTFFLSELNRRNDYLFDMPITSLFFVHAIL
jgi:hypothetical protein